MEKLKLKNGGFLAKQTNLASSEKISFINEADTVYVILPHETGDDYLTIELPLLFPAKLKLTIELKKMWLPGGILSFP